MQYKIVTYPDDRLRKIAIPIEIKDLKTDELNQYLVDLFEMMKEKDGLGLASPQIGIQKRIAVVNTADGPLFLINPKLVKQSLLKAIDEEGCLSVPGVFGKVKRSKKITIKTLDKNGQWQEIVARGLLARVILHEMDHLDGVLFIDKLIK